MNKMSNKFGLPESLLDAVKKIQTEETEYQMKVKALMKKKGITSLSQLSPDEKKAFFNTLDAMHQAKHEEVKPDVAKSFPASGVKKHTAPKGVSTMPKDKEKAKGQPAGSLRKEDIELDEAIPKSTGHALVHSSSRKIVAKGNKAEMMKKMKELNAKEKNSHHLGMTNRGKVGDTFGEEVELEEGKSGTGYELYHKDFSSAMAHAYDFAKKKYNIEVDPQEIDRNVAMGPKKPSSGKANAYRLLDKTGKKAIQVQVTNLDNKRYELNMYKEDLDEERDPPFTPDKPKKNPGVVPGKRGVGPSVAKHLAKMGMKKQMDKSKQVTKEEVEQIDEIGNTPAGQATLGRYVQKRVKQIPKIEVSYQMAPDEGGPFGAKRIKKFQNKVNKGVTRALNRLSGTDVTKKPAKSNEEVELDEGMSAAQIKTLRDAYAKIDKIDVSGQAYKNLVAFLDKLDVNTLKMLAGAKIKFVSGMAQNRVVRKMNEDIDESIGSTIGGALGQYAGAKMGLEGPGRAHGEVLGRQLEMFARAMLKKLTKKEEIELEESGGDVVWKKGNDHIEKYGDEKFALYKDGKKTKYYKSIDDAKAALEEAKDEGASKKKETEFHTKLDKLVHKTFGKSPDEKKMKEASSPAQQAAIAISMKKAGKKPKEESLGIPSKMRSTGARVVKAIMAEKKEMKKEATGKEKPVKSGEKLSNKKEPITIDPEVDEKN